MTPPRYLIDSNVLLRFLTGEPKEMFDASVALVEASEQGSLVLELHSLVIAETCFTLESFYKVPRKQVAATLLEFLNRAGVYLPEGSRITTALELQRVYGIHLLDAFLAATSMATKTPVASFDRDIDRLAGVTRIDPRTIDS